MTFYIKIGIKDFLEPNTDKVNILLNRPNVFASVQTVYIFESLSRCYSFKNLRPMKKN